MTVTFLTLTLIQGKVLAISPTNKRDITGEEILFAIENSRKWIWESLLVTEIIVRRVHEPCMLSYHWSSY